jgi:hypothetical protein
MNSAPAELLQLLTFAALQLQSFLKTETTNTVFQSAVHIPDLH